MSVKPKTKLTKLQKQISLFAKEKLAEPSYRTIKVNTNFYSNASLFSLAKRWEQNDCGEGGAKNIARYRKKLLDSLSKIEIYEIKPQQRSILVETEGLFGDYNNVQTFYLDLPYVQFIKFKLGCYVSCSNESIKNYKTKVGYLPLPNGGENSQKVYICFGAKTGTTPEKIIFDYFNKTFNSSAVYSLDFPKEIKNLRVWQKNTRLTPGFATKVNWKHLEPIGDIISDNIINYGEDYW